MGVIYVRPNLVNGKKYVGQATDLKVRQRKWNNLNKPYAGPAINNARKKYGLDAFGFEILKECSDDELDYWEIYYIEKLGTKSPNGYNLTDGGGGMHGYHFTEETKRKMSEAQRGEKNHNYGKPVSDEQKRKISESLTREKNPNYGKPLNEEHKRKLIEAHIGKPLSEKTKKKISDARKGVPNLKDSKAVLQIDKITGQIIGEFPSTMEIERQLGYSNGNISQCCNGKRNSAYGYKWSFK